MTDQQSNTLSGTQANEQSDRQSKKQSELDYYRSNFFLDPQGSNTERFVKLSAQMLEAVLRMYTKQDVQIDLKVNCGAGTDVNAEASEADGITSVEMRMPVEVRVIDKARVIDNTSAADIKRKVSNYSGQTLPEQGHPLENLVETLTDLLHSEVCFNARFMGQMHPHDNMASFVAGLAGKFVNGNTVAEEVSRVTTYLEKQVVSWLSQEFGYDSATSSGNIAVGGTTANLAAMLVARNKAYGEDIYWKKEGVAESGLTDKEEGIVFGSEYAHYSIEKLCGYVGIGSKKMVKVKTVSKRINTADEGEGSLKQMLWQAAQEGKKVIGVMATAGTTETGNIDDLEGIANLIDRFEAEFKYRPHFHVDAAHGGGFVFHEAFDPKKGGKFKGIERADSITIDPHKMLYVHYSAGCILFKNRRDHALLKQTADYLFKKDEDKNEENNLGEYRVEGSMGLEGVLQTWASLYSLGRRGYQVIHQHVLEMTQYLEQQLRKEAFFEIMNEREMNLLCFRYNNPRLTLEMNNEINRKAQKIMYERGIAYISNDKLLPEYDLKSGAVSASKASAAKIDVFRAVMMHPYTKKEDVDLALAEVKECVGQVIKQYIAQSEEAVTQLRLNEPNPQTAVSGGE